MKAARDNGFRCKLAAGALAVSMFVIPLLTAQAAEKSTAARIDANVLTGGVGEGERRELEQRAREHNLKLVFTMSTGNYLAEVPFAVERGGKVIVEETSRGPWAFVKLPPGAYTVKATFEGKTLTRKVNAPKSGQNRVAFTWPATERVAEQPQPR